MGRRVGSGLLSAVCGLLWASGTAWAGDPGLQSEIQSLKERLSALEAKLAAQEAVSSGAAPGNAVIQLPSGLHGVQMSGYVDTAYNFSFNRPDTGSATSGRNVTSNNGRVLDRVANNFTIHAVNLALEKPLSTESPIGFRTDLLFGDDAEQIHSTGLGDVVAGDNPLPFDLQQAYVTARAPIGAGLDFKVGKFVTLLGSEVIRSLDNWNYSRSFLFGFAIPFTHTGALASYPLRRP